MIQTFYMLYILKTKPHTTMIFNYLEFFNEGALIMLAYVMLIFSGMTPLGDLISKNKTAYTVAEWLGIGIAIAIAVMNFYVMIKMTVDKGILRSCVHALIKSFMLTLELLFV